MHRSTPFLPARCIHCLSLVAGVLGPGMLGISACHGSDPSLTHDDARDSRGGGQPGGGIDDGASMLPDDGAGAVARSRETQCGSDLCVFPGAEGYGALTPAGRGGRVIHVTTLDDDGDGSLRDALTTSGPRTVVFDVSGTIELESEIKIRDPFLTIAGQTAPSPGITVANRTVGLRTHDILIQHLRFRAGEDAGRDADTMNILGPDLTGDQVHSIIIDHCSFSWGIDETLSFNYEPSEITVSSVLVSESLSHAGHSEGEHSKGILFGDLTKNVTLIRSVGAHNVDRNPFVKGGSIAVVANNMFYDWGKDYGARFGSSDSRDWPIAAVFLGNVYVAGPSSPSDSFAVSVHDRLHRDSEIYMNDTLAMGVDAYDNEADFDPLVDAPPLDMPSRLTVIRSNDVENVVLADVGARPRDRDAVDARVLDQIRTRKGGVIDSEKEVGGLPQLAENRKVFDEGSDPSGDDDRDGYSNLEERLHEAAFALEQ